jgi:hypothetical protein
LRHCQRSLAAARVVGEHVHPGASNAHRISRALPSAACYDFEMRWGVSR